MRNLRKRIYSLENSKNALSMAALGGILGTYRLVDTLLLKRSQKLDRRSEKLISRQKKFLCVIVPKCGSRTIIAGLNRAAHQDNFDFEIVETDISNFLDGFNESFRFAFVRNPWARVYSCYVQKIKNATPIKRALHFNGRTGLHPEMTFASFVEWLCGPNGDDAIADRHWASQYLILGLDSGMQYDFIGKLEFMDEELLKICTELDLPCDTFTERRNTSAANPNGYLDHYDENLLKIVGLRYAKDIEIFGFERPRIPSDKDYTLGSKL